MALVGGAFRRCLIPHEWITSLTKETLDSSLALVPWEETAEDTFYESGRRLSSDTKSANILIVAFQPLSRTVRSNCLLLLRQPAYGILL